jgi:hypothetical protein
MFGITYELAWFMAHCIRESMTDANPAPIGGEGKVVEAYHGRVVTAIPSAHGKGRPALKRDLHKQKYPIVALVERRGEVRVKHVRHVTADTIRDTLVRNADRASHLHTDESNHYKRVGPEFASHERVFHRPHDYARGDVKPNSVEGFLGVFKRGFRGIY